MGDTGTPGAVGHSGSPSPLPGWVGASHHIVWTGGPGSGGPGPHGSRVHFLWEIKVHSIFPQFLHIPLSESHPYVQFVLSQRKRRKHPEGPQVTGSQPLVPGHMSVSLGENSTPLARPLCGPMLIPTPTEARGTEWFQLLTCPLPPGSSPLRAPTPPSAAPPPSLAISTDTELSGDPMSIRQVPQNCLHGPSAPVPRLLPCAPPAPEGRAAQRPLPRWSRQTNQRAEASPKISLQKFHFKR